MPLTRILLSPGTRAGERLSSSQLAVLEKGKKKAREGWRGGKYWKLREWRGDEQRWRGREMEGCHTERECGNEKRTKNWSERKRDRVCVCVLYTRLKQMEISCKGDYKTRKEEERGREREGGWCQREAEWRLVIKGRNEEGHKECVMSVYVIFFLYVSTFCTGIVSRILMRMSYKK